MSYCFLKFLTDAFILLLERNYVSHHFSFLMMHKSEIL